MSIFYPPNPPGAGISGPNSSTVGHVATWADTSGTSLADGGGALSDYLPLSGGTLTGDLNFAATPTQNLITADSTNTQIIFTPTVNPSDLAIQFWTGPGATNNSINILQDGTLQLGAGHPIPIKLFSDLTFDVGSGPYNINFGQTAGQLTFGSPITSYISADSGLGNIRVYATADSSGTAALEVISAGNNQGFLPPLLTTVQKNAIVSPAEGLIVYDLTLHALCVYNGTAWKTVTAV